MHTRLFILVILMMGLFSATAQEPLWHWARGTMGSSNNEVTGVSADSRGNVFITGTFQSPTMTLGNTTLVKSGTDAGSTDIFIAMYNPTGYVLWAKSLGGPGMDAANGISADAGGNVVITGYFQSAALAVGSATLINNGASDFFVAKFDLAGTPLWAKSASCAGNDMGSSVATDASGNVCVTGSFSGSPMSFGGATLNNIGNSDAFVVKYNSGGMVQWATSGGGPSPDAGSSISADAAGNVYVTGSFQSGLVVFDGFLLSNTDNSGVTEDVFVTKYSASGNLQWIRGGGGSAFDRAMAICADSSGNVVVTGSFDSPTIKFTTSILANAGGNDVFIVKYDAAGTVKLLKTAGGPGNEAATALSMNKAGDIFIAGYFLSSALAFESFSLTNTDVAGSSPDLFITKLDAFGNVIWAMSEGGTATDAASGISASPGGFIFVGGNFLSPSLIFDETTLTNPGNTHNEGFVAKLKDGAFTDMGISERTASGNILLYPNPFSSQVTLQASREFSNATLTLDNALGQQVKVLHNLSGASIDIAREALPAGLYFVTISEQGSTVLSAKLLIAD